MTRTTTGCPSLETLARSEGGNHPHLTTCGPCRRTVADLAELARAAKDLSWEPPSAERMRRMEAALIALAPDVAPAPPRRHRMTVAGLSAVAAIVAWATFALSPSVEVPIRSEIVATDGARYEHTTRHPVATDDPSLDLVRLAAGTLSLHVEHLSPRQRFVVATADAEVEVRGTRFQVVAEDERLVRVSVQEGKVEVRVSGEAPLLLLPGESWERSAAPSVKVAGAIVDAGGLGADFALAAVEPMPAAGDASPVVMHRRSSRRPAPAPMPVEEAVRTPSSEAELTFAEGWELLRTGDPEGAAARFAATESGYAPPGLAADAAYWRIVALARAGGIVESEARMRSFLERHGTSDRASEVSLMLGLRHAARGDVDGARPLLEQARHAPSARVRAQAGEALDRILTP
ncbi:FecR domain-containing protein [Vulgatibacter incomptus]|uniref:FecR protein domain-containing protein n=1 Tax=Vulgatibacter incomptus TaxID=1391653 RepID=A0A0K1PBN2_9BACT|nr:FecR domain-containing protein [Vulgatibacter incomptus]AKU90935.1 hypothetical protein AKJ08_1322 [Vulgatibacter incomptus]